MTAGAMRKGLCSAILFLVSASVVFASEFNVATFNLRVAQTPKANSWDKRSDSIKRLVRFHDFDVFATQEGWLHQLDYIKGNDGMYAYVADPRDDGKEKGETSAVFYKPSKFELLMNGRFWFSDTPNEPSLGWDAQYKRVCSWAKLRDKSSGKTFFVFSLHFDHRGKGARMSSSKLLVQKAKSIAGEDPVILMGDFNSPASGAPVLYLLSNGYKDAYSVSKLPPYGPEETFHDFTGTPVKGGGRIDLILVSPSVDVLKYGVLSDRLCTLTKQETRFGSNKPEDMEWSALRHPSDHYPVMAKVLLK